MSKMLDTLVEMVEKHKDYREPVLVGGRDNKELFAAMGMKRAEGTDSPFADLVFRGIPIYKDYLLPNNFLLCETTDGLYILKLNKGELPEGNIVLLHVTPSHSWAHIYNQIIARHRRQPT